MLMIVDVHWRSRMCRAPRAIGGELLIAIMWMLRALVLRTESMKHVPFYHLQMVKHP